MKSRTLQNRGFSLVEVIVAVAIMSIVVAGAFQLIVSGSKMYTKTSTSVDVQTEAQLLENQLNNMIVDAERGVFAGSGTDSAGFTADSYVKVFNTANVCYIAWDSAAQTVYFMEKTVTDGEVEELTEAEKNISNWYLMGENVTGFSPDTSHVSESQRLVVIELQVVKRDVHYSTVQNISLRNNVLESNDLSDLYGGESVEGEVTITDVAVSPKVVSLNRGASLGFSATVRAGGSVAPSQNVVWSIVSGNSSANTTISPSGQLTIGLDEAGSVITIKATAEGTTIFDTATVIIPQVLGVTVTSSNMTPGAGGMAIFSAEVTGSNLDLAARAVIWSVSAPAEYADLVSVTTDGILYVGSTVPEGTQITVTATAAVTVGTDYEVSGNCMVTVSGSVETGFVITADKSTLNRGGSLTMHAVLDGTDLSAGNGNLYWTIEDDAGLGDKVHISTAGVLTADRDISYAGTYTITVKASTGNMGGGISYETTAAIQIPAVSILFGSNSGYVVKGQTVRFPYTVYGLENAGTDLSVSSQPSMSGLSGTFMYCTDSELVVTIGAGVNRSSATITVSLTNNTNVSGSVVLTIKGASNVEGLSIYVPTPNDRETFPSSSQFERVQGTDRSNVVSLVMGNQTYIYWIEYSGNDQIYHLMVNQIEYIYSADLERWSKVS